MKQPRPLLSTLLVLGLLSTTSFALYADDDHDNKTEKYEKYKKHHHDDKKSKKNEKALKKAQEKLEKALAQAHKELRYAKQNSTIDADKWQATYDTLLLEYHYFKKDKPSKNSQFQFALIGDAPYARDISANFTYLTESVNSDEDISFTVHIGDFKSGSTECSNERFIQSKELFNQFIQPLIYTPGDNEWTDCHRPASGHYLPTERLDYLRELFFEAPVTSLGQNPMALISQADNSSSPYVDFAENVMWTKKEVIFATLNVTGSRNNLLPWTGFVASESEGCDITHGPCGVPDSFLNPRADRLEEFKVRELASLDWLDQVFAAANNNDSPAVVLAFQANPNFEMERYLGDRQGFNNIIDRIKLLTLDYGKPVLLMHGDYHKMFIDHPIETKLGSTNFTYNKFLRIQSYGTPDMNWVKINVDTSKEMVFSIELIDVDEARQGTPNNETPVFYDAPQLPVP